MSVLFHCDTVSCCVVLVLLIGDTIDTRSCSLAPVCGAALDMLKSGSLEDKVYKVCDVCLAVGVWMQTA